MCGLLYVSPVVLFGSVIIFYSVLGLFADAFIGRYRLVQFSLWIQWVKVIVSTLIIALLEYYHIAEWIWSLLFLILVVTEMLGLSSFQVVAIQFGTDQLQGAPSQFLSAFVFWYLMIEILLAMLIEWIIYFLSFSKNRTLTAKIPLAWNLLSAGLVSLVLCRKSCFMSKFSQKRTPHQIVDYKIQIHMV